MSKVTKQTVISQKQKASKSVTIMMTDAQHRMASDICKACRTTLAVSAKNGVLSLLESMANDPLGYRDILPNTWQKVESSLKQAKQWAAEKAAKKAAGQAA